MTRRPDMLAATVLLSELADVLAGHGQLTCAPTLDVEKDAYVLSVAIPRDELKATELACRLEFLARAAHVRAFRNIYGDDVEPLLDVRGSNEERDRASAAEADGT